MFDYAEFMYTSEKWEKFIGMYIVFYDFCCCTICPDQEYKKNEVRTCDLKYGEYKIRQVPINSSKRL